MVSLRYPSLLCLLSMLVWLVAVPVYAQDAAAIARGEYLFRAAGGCSCHTDAKNNGAFMAGGRAIKTPFGRIYSSNITPAPKTGIGTWSDADFLKAMTEGVGPDGKQYFPAFPYPSFTRMTKQDVLDLKAYLFSLPAVEQANKPPALWPPFGWRFGVRVWKWLYFRPGTLQADPTQTPEWNRGAYLATAPGHCTECHTPRNSLGGLKTAMAYAGSVEGPEGELAPNITPDQATGIGEWSIADLVWFLQTGLKPDGDDTQGLMSEQITSGYKYLSEADLRAIAVYLRALQPIRNKVSAKDAKKE
jgi:mono/diheme cytochrome c family protein